MLIAEKLCFMENCTILLGIDTLKRLFDLKYYNNSNEEMICILSEFLKKKI